MISSFLGFNSSLTMPSHDLPGYIRNQIYYRDYIYSLDIEQGAEEDSDVAVFNLEDGTIQLWPGFKCHPRFLWHPQVWVKTKLLFYHINSQWISSVLQ